MAASDRIQLVREFYDLRVRDDRIARVRAFFTLEGAVFKAHMSER